VADKRVAAERGRGWASVAGLATALALSACGGSPASQQIAGADACSSAVANAPRLRLPQQTETLRDLPSQPYAVAASAKWAFVSYPPGYHPGTGLISVLAMRGSAARLARTVSVPGEPFGVALAGDNRFLLVANYLGGLEILSASALETGKGPVVIAQLASGGQGSDEVVVSADQRYAFVPEEESSDVAVYALGDLLEGNQSGPAVTPHEVGAVPVGASPAGIALSAGGAVLYVISQSERANPESNDGELFAISVSGAEHDPAHAVIGSVNAGCDPVRVAISPSGRIAWVTDRGANSVLAFRLSPPTNPAVGRLAAAIRVGSEPVGITLIDSGDLALVTDSARYSQPNAPQTIAVIDTSRALTNQHALLGLIPAGAFPRQFGQAPDGPLLFTDYDSQDVRVISTSDLQWLRTLLHNPS